MWRIALFIVLFCSIGLNVYLFVQLNVRTIEKSLLSNNHQESVTQHISRTHKAKANVDNALLNNEPLLADKIKIAINDKDYFLAGFLINTLANDYKNQLPEVRTFWLDATKTLITEGQFNYAENSISAFLAFQSDDVDFLYLQVDLFLQQKLVLSAIKYAYEVQYHVFTEPKKHEVILFARQLVQQQADALINNNLWIELRELVEQISIFDPENINLQWLFVRAQYQLGEFEHARNAIKPLLTQPNYKLEAKALLAKIEVALRKPESIPLRRHGEHYIVQAFINDTFNLSLMIDTGASISLLSEEAFDALKQYSDVEYIEDLTLNTAGGQVIASIYQVDEFSIQGYSVNNFIFAVSPFVSAGNDGLLGMNYLSAFDFYIDQVNNLLVLDNK